MPRPVGSKNKEKEDFRNRIKRYCEETRSDPFKFMVDIINKKGVPYPLKILAAKELMQYLEPKLRSVEVTGDPEKPLMILSPDARQERIAALEAKRNARMAPQPLSLIEGEPE